MNWQVIKIDTTNIPNTYKTLSQILLLGILTDKNAEMIVTQTDTKSQKQAVKSLALKLEYTMLPNTSTVGQPQPNHFTINSWFAQLYGISNKAKANSGDKSNIAFFNFIKSLSLDS